MHPDVPSDEKLDVFEKIFKGKISEEFLSLFSLVLRKNREGELCNILKAFMQRVLKYKKITTAYVSSAKALSNEQLLSIKEKLSANLNKQVNIEAITDESLIGGVKIAVDGHVYDATVKKSLNDLKESLLNIQLAQ
jgi:ATP synthase F1 delta subunit